MQTRPLLLLLAALSTVRIASAAEPQAPSMKMHRTQAGVPDSTGWVLADSTEGGFSVRLPARFNDFTTTDPSPASQVTRAWTVGAVTEDGAKLSATRIVYRDGARAAREFFAKHEKGTSLNASPLRLRSHEIEGRRVVDLVIGKESSAIYQRIVLLDSELIVMIAVTKSAPGDKPPPFVSTFFDSLVVKRPSGAGQTGAER